MGEALIYAASVFGLTAYVDAKLKNLEMRKIKYIVVHCTAGSQRQTVGDLLSEFSRKGWRNPGYHVVIMPDGSRRQLLDFSRIANGVRGHNADAIHVAYVGGIDAHGRALDNRTEAQK